MGDLTEPQQTRRVFIVMSWRCWKEAKGEAGVRWDETQADMIMSSLLYSIICLLGGPELFVLFAPKALVIVAFAFEQLLEVRFAVKFTLKSCKAAKAARK